MIGRLVGGRYGALVTLIALVFASPLFAPQLLAFPYKVRSGDSIVWSERPVEGAALDRVIARAEKLVAASPLAREREPRKIFLTDGGWRWTWLANTARGTFALTRPLTDPVVVVHRSDVSGDSVTNAAGGERRLSAVIAHETAHGMLRRRFGPLALIGKPQWLVEGYCEYVAQETFLTAEQAARLESRGEDHPALPYFRGRQKVAAILDANGGDVDALFAEH